MASTFEPWLRQLAAAGKGPAPMTIDRGLPFISQFVIAAPMAGTASAAMRLAPDAGGAVLLAFTASAVTVEGDYASFTLSLTKEQTRDLPADTDGDALVELAYDILFTPSGGTQMRLLGGVATVTGKVTDGT